MIRVSQISVGKVSLIGNFFYASSNIAVRFARKIKRNDKKKRRAKKFQRIADTLGHSLVLRAAFSVTLIIKNALF